MRCNTCGRPTAITTCGECPDCASDPSHDGAVTALREMLKGMPEALDCLEQIVAQRDDARRELGPAEDFTMDCRDYPV